MPHVIASYGKNRLPGDMVQKMGGEVIDLGNRPSMEEIMASQPDVIFLIYKSNSDICVKNEFMQNRIYNSGVKTLDALKVMERNLWENISK